MDGGEVLIVDLDGTLHRSDMLHESYWAAARKDYKNIFLSPLKLFLGRANFKRFLALNSEIDVTTLPFNQEVVAYTKTWRDSGGRTALITATDQILADAVARHLGLFDEVHGSNAQVNLKGEAKAELIDRIYGKIDFTYVGDSVSDLPIWTRAGKAVTVNAPAWLRARVEHIAPNCEHLVSKSRSWKDYAEAARPHQWLKNLLCFVPMLAAHQLNPASILAALPAFLAFNFVASATYLVNDLLDLEADRAHPRKRERPMAAGKVPLGHAALICIASMAAGILMALMLPTSFLAALTGYVVLSSCYSFWLKRRPVIDICVLAGLYTIRIIAGGEATGTPISTWLLAFSIFLFFSLAAIKRQTELVTIALKNEGMAAGRGYRAEDLPVIGSAALAAGYVAVLVLALYISSPQVLELYAQPKLLFGVCCVLLYWVTRTALGAQRGAIHDDPVVFAITDRVSQMCGVIAIGIIVGATLL
jgi:4-hydroxybenzoate polyprenyltransferase